MESKPGLVYRPFLDLAAASRLLEEHYGLKAAHIEELESFADRNFEVTLDAPVTLGRGVAQNQFSQFILKVYNSKDSVDGNRIELAVNTMDYLWKEGFCCPLPVPNLRGKLLHLEKVFGKETHEDAQRCHGLFMVTLLTYIPGRILSSLNPAPCKVFVDVGRHLARLHLLLELTSMHPRDKYLSLHRLEKDFIDYDHNRPSTYCSGEWSLVKLPGQRHLLDLVHNPEIAKNVETVIDAFEEHVVPVLPVFREGIIHGDFNDNNIIVSQQQEDSIHQSSSKSHDQYGVAGIIDFGEVAHTCIIFDIAIAVAELMTTKADDPFESAAHFLLGYASVKGIPDVERKALYHLVLARNAQLVLLCLESRKMDPDNDYIMASYDDCCSQLRELVSMQKHYVEARWNI